MKKRNFLRHIVAGIFSLTPLAFFASCSVIDAETLNDFFGEKKKEAENQPDSKALEQLKQKNVELSNKSAALENKVTQVSLDYQSLLTKNNETQTAFEEFKKSVEEAQLSERAQKNAAVLNSPLYQKYVEAKYRLGRLEAEKKVTKEKLEEASEAFENLKNAYRLATKAKEVFLSLQELEEKREKNQRLLRLAKEDYESAYYNNWYLGKEIALYIFTLKIVWGIFTGFAASTSSSQQLEKWEELQRSLKTQNHELQTQISSARQELNSILAALPEAFEASGQKTLSAQTRVALNNFKNRLLLNLTEIDSARRALRHQEEIFHESLKVKDFAEFQGEENYNLFDYNYHKALMNLEKKRGQLFDLFDQKNDSSFTTLLEKSGAEVTQLEMRVETLNSQSTEAARELSLLVLSQPRSETVFRGVDKKISVVQKTVNNYKRRAQELQNQLEEKTAFLKALEQTYDSANRTRVAFEGVLETYKREEEAAFKVLVKEKELQRAYQNNHRFGKEFALYTLGFKWLWGIFTGYARNPDVAKETKALEEAKKMKLEVANAQQRALSVANQNFFELKNQTLTLLEQAALRAKSVGQKSALLKLEALFEEAFKGMQRSYASTKNAFEEFSQYLLSDRFALRLNEDRLFSPEVLGNYESKVMRANAERGEFDTLFKTLFEQLFGEVVEEVDQLSKEVEEAKVGFEESFHILLTTREADKEE